MSAPVASDALVSIVIPAFNAAATIEATLQSARAQTYANFEALVVDDGSSDDTVARAEAIAAEDDRVRVLTSPHNSGLPAVPRNRGMAAARGEYIAFLDADDLWRPEKLQKQVDYLLANPDADAVCSWIEPFKHAEGDSANPFILRTSRVCSRDEILTGMPFFTSTLLMRRRCYEQLGGFDEDPGLRSVEDAEYFARLLVHCAVHRLPEPLVLYRLSSGPRPSISASEADILNTKGWRLQQVLEKKKLLRPQELRRRRAFLWYETGRANLHSGTGRFRPYLLKALASGYCNWRVILTLALSFLPRPALATVLTTMQDAANRRKRKHPNPRRRSI